MSDDTAIIAAAAKQVLDADIAKYVPPFFQGKIPVGTTDKTAQEIAVAVVAALAKAHPTTGL